MAAGPIHAPPFLGGDSEMARRMREFDWRATELGPPDGWRPSLKAMVRMLLSTRHPAFIFWGAQQLCIYNDAYSQSIGPEKHPSILGQAGRDAWPEIWSIIGPQIEFVMRGDGATWHENQLVPIVRHGGLQNVYWTYSYGPIDDEVAPHGVGGVLVLCTETTEQVEAKRRLALEHERFQQLFEQAPTFMALLRGPQHRFELANPVFVRLVGERPLIGKTILEALPEMAGQGYVGLLDAVYRSGQPHVAAASKYVVPDAAGAAPTEHYVDFVYQPILDAAGAVEGIFVVGADVTQRHEVESKLRRSEDRFRLAVDSSSLGTFDIDFENGSVHLSPQAQALFDFASAGVSLGAWLGRVHRADRAAVDAALEASRRRDNGGHYRLEHRIVRGDGTLRWIDMSGTASNAHDRVANDSEGSHECLAGVLWDTTEHQQMLQTLRTAGRRKDEFLATLAHELRNPLAPIHNAAHLLGKADIAPDRVAWCGDVIRRQSETMALLLDDLLEISRITSGKLELKKAYVELRETVESALEAARPLIDGRGHTLDVEWPEAPIQLEADPLRVTQILTNLLTNAAKYTEAGGRIALRARHDAEHAVLEVQDNGIGIAAEQLPMVFEMFHQLEGALGRAEGGLGIGLALAKGLAEMHGGTLQAMSAGAGHGATFRLRLPLGNPPSSKQVEAIASGAHTCTSRKRRVLIADDNRDAAVLFGALLEIEGYDVDLAYDGTQALEAVFQDRHDAAFLDIGMPGLNGYELAARIRSEAWGSKLLLIATTGWGRDDDKRRALVAGFDVHLTKPLVPDAATRLLAERLGGAGA